MTTCTDIAWLAGIIDGEGCFSIKKSKARPNSRQIWIVMCNTSEPMMLRYNKILESLGVGHQPMRKVWKGEKATRWQFWVHVARKTEALKLTEALLPYLTAKKDEATIVAWYLRRACKHKAYKSNETELELLDMLKIIKSNGGEAPVDVRRRINEVIPSEATEGFSSVERVETRNLSPNNNDSHERPAPSDFYLTMGDDIVRYSEETRRVSLNS